MVKWSRLGWHRAGALGALGAMMAALLAATPAWATTVRALDAAELVASSAAVLVGVARAQESSWQGGRIVTRYEVEVTEAWAGELRVGDVVTVEVLGGQVGGLGQLVHGAPRLVLDEPTVLFVAPGPLQRLRPVGLWQGVWRIDAADPRQRLWRTEAGAAVVAGPALAWPESLPELRQRVLELWRGRP